MRIREFTSTMRFGTSMSAYHILGLEKVPRVRLFAVKVVHELGSERRETVRSVSVVGVGELRERTLVRETESDDPLVSRLSRQGHAG